MPETAGDVVGTVNVDDIISLTYFFCALILSSHLLCLRLYCFGLKRLRATAVNYFGLKCFLSLACVFCCHIYMKMTRALLVLLLCNAWRPLDLWVLGNLLWPFSSPFSFLFFGSQKLCFFPAKKNSPAHISMLFSKELIYKQTCLLMVVVFLKTFACTRTSPKAPLTECA